VYGGPGNDRIGGGPGAAQRRRGGFGDHVHGGPGDDVSDGGPGRDKMSGGAGNDSQSGGAGNDLIFANQGADVSEGGDGNDVLWALARVDVTSPGDPNGDALSGGNGNDRFRVRDGEADRITCGNGNDVVIADQFDVITDATGADANGSCERVVRGSVPDSDSPEAREENQANDRKEG
jgi:Ca2+-binding RTX toxin-like protein